MEMQTITAKWKKAGRISVLIINIGTFIIFGIVGFFIDYKQNGFNSRWQMVLLMTGLGTIFSLILAWLTLWVFLWKLEIKNDKLIVFGFLKKTKAYKLSSLTTKTRGEAIYIKYNGKTITGVSAMIQNGDEIVRAIELQKG